MYYSIHIIEYICMKFYNERMCMSTSKDIIFITNIILSQAVT